MKRYGALIALVLAVGFGTVAVILAQKWMSSQKTQPQVVVQETVPTTKIVVAAKDMDIGTPLSPENLILVEWPKASVPKGAFSEMKPLMDRVMVTRVWTGTPILEPGLAPIGSGAGMLATISQGKRAMSVRVDEVSGVGGFVLPGTYVDIIAVDEERNKKGKAETILERKKVLAIAQETFTENGKPKVVKTVTLELDPNEAEKLALKTHEGPIRLVLRNPLDEDIPKPQIVAKPKPQIRTVVKKIYIKPDPPAIPPPPPEPLHVEVIRRSERENLKFKNTEMEIKEEKFN